MKFDRDFLVDVHNDIKTDMTAIGLVPHRSRQHLISRNAYRCDFYTLRYWRSKDTAWLTDHWYDQSCLELLVCNNRLYIGIWFGLTDKSIAKDKSRIKSRMQEIMAKQNDYPVFTWSDENGTSAPADEKLIQWLCETSHETVFRKELTDYNKDDIVSEMKHLKEYLDFLL
ncbi:MAG TPA: hypothetical protein PLS20_03605 [Ruminococcus flavefaciens]|nr:hypothetical protein [Ruminococcus flavefaciens]